ncbi:hypothetical protein COCSUDRAFT_34411 [Coccomyxa subellipsoidea C-169]|uniref:Secreted protein n=1 Tax=Coccomyxa subellipsoidea (strain C-169) TaxID=574566 RepID=I0YKF2_COCSC|nr:hypothetical protein COCSUDRAFT_34411 [Coccomyxa subellipsoidea C-169]EIE18871.1 hypothetical protein COCSUDRAFT_34411 [Coccomyxa subellipsoidea C-169]|eukprot:XP_005643415.1 hypothetical protein COCSUDRAFT_34411 [Coccomyxa subellipsoidea C-169]
MFLLGIVIVIVPHFASQAAPNVNNAVGWIHSWFMACSAHIRESLRAMLASGSECCYYTDDHSYSAEVLRDNLELACKFL